ncbi:helix-turn-helix domain-containing protein [Microbacterium sp.]|uniref:helix-turn-helix domain-containing protein n=1 Tax=Microbacterium sp. TaxID=51671 RepID=UPI00324245F4
MLTDDQWVTMEQTALMLNVSAKTVRRRIADGTLKAKRFGPRLLRVELRSVRAAGVVVGGDC